MVEFLKQYTIWVAFVACILAAWVSYRLGIARGKRHIQLEGAYCDVCMKTADKFFVFKMTVMCPSCYQSILNNKEMKCRFCENHIEKCICT